MSSEHNSRISVAGLPSAVATSVSLPQVAYLGHLCYVVEDETLRLFNGSDYVTVGGSSSESSTLTAASYEKVSDLPASADAGTIAFAQSTKALYYYTGTAWTKVASTSDTPST